MQTRAGCVAQQYQPSGLYVNFSGRELMVTNGCSSSIIPSEEKKQEEGAVLSFL